MALLMEIVDRISDATGADRRAVMGRVNRLKREMQVDAEVVALVVASDDGVDVAEFIDRVDAEVVAKARAAMKAGPGGKARGEGGDGR
ncbi:MAG: DUF2240 family protein [Thermoplasmata archaeon]|nr:DUF2240 family protein [Thermoplasmata archaeon]